VAILHLEEHVLPCGSYVFALAAKTHFFSRTPDQHTDKIF